MKEINIAELLKDCPKGMELDSPLYDNLVFCKIDSETRNYTIITQLPNGEQKWFTSHGRYDLNPNAKCVIFPQGKTTWEGFVPPYKFKDGDVVHVMSKKGVRFVFIFKEIKNGLLSSYACLSPYQIHVDGNHVCPIVNVETMRLATEEEKHELFDAIKAGGYKWNAETKTLEMLVEPKFKVGDRIKEKQSGVIGKVIDVQRSKYNVKLDDNKGLYVWFREQDAWELSPSKFDVNTLKPFDKVLYRKDNNDTWCAGFFNLNIHNTCFLIGNTVAHKCIPYEGNEHLHNTTDDCDEYYKTW